MIGRQEEDKTTPDFVQSWHGLGAQALCFLLTNLCCCCHVVALPCPHRGWMPAALVTCARRSCPSSYLACLPSTWHHQRSCRRL